MEEHFGELLSGEVVCSCGWRSGHYALARDAIKAYNEHLEQVETTEVS